MCQTKTGLGFPKLGQQRGLVLRKRGSVFPEQSSCGVLPSAPASRAQPPGTPTAENSAGQPGPIVSLRSLCSWAVCFQCPGTDFPTCQLSSSSSCLCTALGLWKESGLAGSEGSGGSPSVMWQLNMVKPLEPVLGLSLGHREGRDSRREAAPWHAESMGSQRVEHDCVTNTYLLRTPLWVRILKTPQEA